MAPHTMMSEIKFVYYEQILWYHTTGLSYMLTAIIYMKAETAFITEHYRVAFDPTVDPLAKFLETYIAVLGSKWKPG